MQELSLNTLNSNQRAAQAAARVIVFRADASLEIGTGHVMRCLTLADALIAQGVECHFICREHQGHLIDAIKARGVTVHRLPMGKPESGVMEEPQAETPPHAHWLGASWQQDATACRKLLEALNPAWLVMDHYALDARWQEAVMPAGRAKLLVIDDLADRPHRADLLLDQNLGRKAEDYAPLVPSQCRMLVGPHFALLRPEFAELRAWSLARRRDAPFKRLLISLGGVDKDNATGQLLKALSTCELPSGTHISVVMGATAPWQDTVKQQAAGMPWPTDVVVNVSDMARRMAEADVAIGAAGSTSWERCCLGLPTLMLVLAENQQPIAEALEKAGVAICLGGPNQLSGLAHQLDALQQPAALKAMSSAAAKVTAGEGVASVCNAMFPQEATLRPLQETDLAMVRRWRNHPDVRSYMYTQHEISAAEHSAWFKRSQTNPLRHLLVAEQEGQPFGFVNIELANADAKRAEWGFYLAPEALQGSGQALGLAALSYAFGTLALHKLCGEALASNQRSRRFHERLGFTQEAYWRDHHFDGHTYHDVIGYGLLRSEWQARQGA